MTIEQIAGLIARETVARLNIDTEEGRKVAYQNALNTILKEELVIVSPEGKLETVKA